MGDISLSEGQSAPAGGIIGSLNGNRFYIPEGKNKAFFITGAERGGVKNKRY
jgi:hypothetical protein